MNNIKKLCLYSLDCIKSTKNNAFCNLKSSKDNKIYITNDLEFNADNKEIVEIMTKYALNKSTMSVLYGRYIVESNKYYCPLLFTDAELVRNGDKIELIYNDDFEINYSLISSLLENDVEIVENVVNQIMTIENPEQIDIISVLNGLIPDFKKLDIKNEKSIILTKTPESIAGVINELRLISELY